MEAEQAEQAEQDFTDNREWRKRMFEHIQFGAQQEQVLHDLIFELEEEDGPTFPKERCQRMRPTQQDYGNCAWQTLYLDNPDVRNPASDVGKLFRRGFRVPYPIFERLCAIAVTLGFTDKTTDLCGRDLPPLRLKVSAAHSCIDWLITALSGARSLAHPRHRMHLLAGLGVHPNRAIDYAPVLPQVLCALRGCAVLFNHTVAGPT